MSPVGSKDFVLVHFCKVLYEVKAGGISLVGLGGASGYAWMSGVGLSVCPMAAAAGALVYTAGLGVMMASTVAFADHKLGVKGKFFKDVGPHANDAVMKFLKLELKKKKKYSIDKNNCNHFADRLLNFVLDNSKSNFFQSFIMTWARFEETIDPSNILSTRHSIINYFDVFILKVKVFLHQRNSLCKKMSTKRIPLFEMGLFI